MEVIMMDPGPPCDLVSSTAEREHSAGRGLFGELVVINAGIVAGNGEEGPVALALKRVAGEPDVARARTDDGAAGIVREFETHNDDVRGGFDHRETMGTGDLNAADRLSLDNDGLFSSASRPDRQPRGCGIGAVLDRYHVAGNRRLKFRFQRRDRINEVRGGVPFEADQTEARAEAKKGAGAKRHR